MSENDIIRNCAPTLAGLKTGSMFVCPYTSEDSLRSSIRQLNRQLTPKGLRVIPLRLSGNRALVYFYRPKKLSEDLSDTAAAALLRNHGYDAATCEGCILQLVRKLREQEDFPHEIGLFLGYPAEDVRGFIENQACNCKCAGCWKVYGDEDAAKKRFAQYRKCTRVYQDCWSRGTAIERLTVAC